MIFTLGAGCFTNVGADANEFVKILARISPLRYADELQFRQLTEELKV